MNHNYFLMLEECNNASDNEFQSKKYQKELAAIIPKDRTFMDGEFIIFVIDMLNNK